MIATGGRARVAVVGTGWWSTYSHIPGLIENPAADLVAVVDTDRAALDRCAAVYNAGRTYTDLEEMIGRENPDGVVIAIPHAHHYDIELASLRRNAGSDLAA